MSGSKQQVVTKISLLNAPSTTFPDKSTNTFDNLHRIPSFCRCSRDAACASTAHTNLNKMTACIQYACTDVEFTCKLHFFTKAHTHKHTQSSSSTLLWRGLCSCDFKVMQHDPAGCLLGRRGARSPAPRGETTCTCCPPATVISNRPPDVTQNPWGRPDSRSKRQDYV